MSVYKISQCMWVKTIPGIGTERERHGVDSRFILLGELDRSSTDPRVLNGIWNHERCSLSNGYLSHELTCPINQRRDRNNVHAIDQNEKYATPQTITLASSRPSCPPSTPPQMSSVAPSRQSRTLAVMPRAAPYQRSPL